MKLSTTTILVLIALLATSFYCIDKVIKENKELKTNQETLLSDIEHYKINDSINVARVGELTLSLKDYKKYRAEDKALIDKLKNSDKIKSASNVKVETKIENVYIPVHDTIIQQESLRAFEYISEWTDINGLIYPDSVALSIANREELIITETLEKKKLWFIKLPAWLFGYKSKSYNVISKNPNTEITEAEFITIK